MIDKLRTEDGATLVEYAFLLILVVVVCIVVVASIGTNTSSMFDPVEQGFPNLN